MGAAALRRPPAPLRRPPAPQRAVALAANGAARQPPVVAAAAPPRAGKALAKPPWNEVLQRLRPHFMERRGTQMASVPMLLALLKVPRSKRQNLARDLARWKNMRNWTVSQVDQCKRKGPTRKPGGSGEAVAMQDVLQILYVKY